MKLRPLSKLFAIGQFVITSSALARVNLEDMCAALPRHVSGDWGNVPNEIKGENDRSLILSRDCRSRSGYSDRNGTGFWIITEADRSATNVFLEEY